MTKLSASFSVNSESLNKKDLKRNKKVYFLQNLYSIIFFTYPT